MKFILGSEFRKNHKYYHIFNHANGFENIFIDGIDRQRFLEKYLKYIIPIADTYTYCLMSNHFHVLVRIKSLEDLHKVLDIVSDIPFEGLQPLERLNYQTVLKKISYRFSHFFNSYAQAFNKRYDRMGGLF